MSIRQRVTYGVLTFLMISGLIASGYAMAAPTLAAH